MRPFTNFAELYNYVSDTYSNPCAFNYKALDKWNSIPTAEFIKQVKHLSLALHSLGVKKGDAVGILAFPSPFWLMADLAILSIGAVTVPFFPSGSEEHLAYKIKDSGLKLLFLFCTDIWDRVEPHLHTIQKVIFKDFNVENGKAVSFENFLKIGAELASKQPQLHKTLLDGVEENDLATIIYTSGSTGVPKGVELIHKNVISQLYGAGQLFPLDSNKDMAITCIPIAHSFEHTVVYYYISRGISIYFNSDIKKLGEDLKEIRPTLIVLVPRIFEKVYAKIRARVSAASPLEKIIGSWAINIALKHNPETDRRGIKFQLANLLVFKKLKKALGGRLRYVITGGAALRLDLYRFFLNIGVPLFQGYGTTEAAPILTANYPGNHKIGTIGKAYPEVTLKVDEDGELLAKGPNIMRGYHNKPKETAETIDPQGWLHTGDLVVMDSDGYVTITGRKKDLLKTSGGKYVSSVPIEQELCCSSLIDMAMVIAEGKSFVSCLLFPDPEYIKKWKQPKGLSDVEFLNSPLIKKKIDALIARINQRLDEWEQIKQYRLILDPLSIESGELTPTMKIKKHVILEKYKDLIDEIYKQELE